MGDHRRFHVSVAVLERFPGANPESQLPVKGALAGDCHGCEETLEVIVKSQSVTSNALGTPYSSFSCSCCAR